MYFTSGSVSIAAGSNVNYTLNNFVAVPDGYRIAAVIPRTSYTSGCHKLNARVIYAASGYILFFTNDTTGVITTEPSADVILLPL